MRMCNMKQSIRVALVLFVLATLTIVATTDAAVAGGMCQSIGDITTQCGCPAGSYCG